MHVHLHMAIAKQDQTGTDKTINKLGAKPLVTFHTSHEAYKRTGQQTDSTRKKHTAEESRGEQRTRRKKEGE